METSLNMNDNFINNVKKAINIDQAVSKGQMDTELNKKLNTFDAYQPEVNANLDMNNHFIRNVKNPDLENDAASKRYVDKRIHLRASKRDLEFYLPLDFDKI